MAGGTQQCWHTAARSFAGKPCQQSQRSQPAAQRGSTRRVASTRAQLAPVGIPAPLPWSGPTSLLCGCRGGRGASTRRAAAAGATRPRPADPTQPPASVPTCPTPGSITAHPTRPAAPIHISPICSPCQPYSCPPTPHAARLLTHTALPCPPHTSHPINHAQPTLSPPHSPHGLCLHSLPHAPSKHPPPLTHPPPPTSCPTPPHTHTAPYAPHPHTPHPAPHTPPPLYTTTPPNTPHPP